MDAVNITSSFWAFFLIMPINCAYRCPEAVLAINQVWTVLHEMTRDPGGNDPFEELPHIVEEANRSIRQRRVHILPEFRNENQSGSLPIFSVLIQPLEML